ncbi:MULTISPECIES: MFS transporter [unclassified Sphingomonas]|uniref:MFS transporter n=1 Tax=unclassified Sphingomonas TaxID=196159 RepID=UPI001AC1ABA4|nr:MULTISPECIES: MFS transporter [unclassified Sphingomonas]MBN8849660.1 MFS transporter [Sphingomonas sp.]
MSTPEIPAPTVSEAGPSDGAQATPSPVHAWLAWVLATGFVVYLFNIQTGYSIVNVNVQKDVGLTLTQVGLIASIYTWAFAICQFFGGALLDRLGARLVIVPAVALVTIGVFVFSIADSFAMLVVSQLILAVGSCVGFVGAGYVGGQWFGMARYGVMFGLVQTVASLSSAFGQTGISIALNELTWRELAVRTVYLGIVLTVLAAIFVRNPRPLRSADGNLIQSVGRSLLDVAKIPHMWIAALWGAVSFGSQLAMGVVWAPKLLVAHGIGTQMADLGSAMVWLGLAAGCVFWNPWAEHIRSRKIPALTGLAIQFVVLLALLFLPLSPVPGIALMFLFGLGSSAHMIAFSTAGDVVAANEVGTSAAFVNGAMFIMGGILVSLPGYWLAGTDGTLGNYPSAFTPFLVLLAVAIVLATIQRETFPSR